MNEYIKSLINLNKESINNIDTLDKVLKSIDVKTSNDKIEFGYLCIVLESLNTIVTRTGQLLFNNNVIKNEEGNYYVKVDDKA